MSPTLKRRNQPHAPALIEAAYSQAWTAMRLLISFLLAWPRTTRAVVGIGAVGLLFYGASFYTRDWRPVVGLASH
jgi:CHASE2 domain-containing sensor protein